MIVQLYTLSGDCITVEIIRHAEIIIYKDPEGKIPQRYFYLDAGRYVEARSVAWT